MVLWKARRWRYSAKRHVEAELCAMYWMFVSGLWIILFGLVYLS
jgi:heme/copper-type cytochrome/quinol oxidase subunit 3